MPPASNDGGKVTVPRHPMQPLVVSHEDRIRFKENAIVRFLLDHNGEGRKIDMNTLASMDFTQDDRTQFAQLIGYTLDGFHELPYVADEDALAASEAAKVFADGPHGCRAMGCGVHTGVARQ